MVAFGSAAVISGAAFYFLVALVGSAFPVVVDPYVITALGALLSALWYLLAYPRWLPSSKKQMNRRTANLPGVGLYAYGAVLGVGVLTIVTTPLLWVGMLHAFLSRSMLWGAVFGAAFGLGRVLPLAVHVSVGTPAQAVDLRILAVSRWRVRLFGVAAGMSLAVLAGA